MLLLLLTLLAPARADQVAFPVAELPRVQTETQAQAIRGRAIEASVREVNWFLRPFARSRLNKVTTTCPAYRLIVRDPDFEVQCDGETVFSWTLGRSGTWTTETGEEVHVTLVEHPGAFTLRFQAPGGAKTFHYQVLGPDRLRVTQTIDSARLPRPVQYALDYGTR